MAKVRVYELAKSLNKDSKEIIEILKKDGVEVKNHMSSVTEEDADKVRGRFAKKEKVATSEKKEVPAKKVEATKKNPEVVATSVKSAASQGERRERPEGRPQGERRERPEGRPQGDRRDFGGNRPQGDRRDFGGKLKECLGSKSVRFMRTGWVYQCNGIHRNLLLNFYSYYHTMKQDFLH